MCGKKQHSIQNTYPHLVSFHHVFGKSRLVPWKVNGLDVNIWVECVLVKENRASSVMGHVERISQNLVIDVLRCFL